MNSNVSQNNGKFARYFQLILVVIAAGSIFPIIYLRHGYEVTILEVFNMESSGLNNIFSVMGIVTIIGYFPSGYLSDRFSAKWLLAISLFMTGAMGLWFAQIPSYTHVTIIYIVWGFFSIFTFWSAHLKLVKLLSRSGEEGRFFGIWDGGRGVVEAILAMAALFIFSRVMGESEGGESSRQALVGVIYMYSFFLLAVAILVAFFVKDDKGSKRDKEGDFSLSGLKELCTNKLIFLMGGIIFMGYSVFWTFRTMSSFMQNNLGITAVTAATMMVIAQWMRPIGGIVGGFLADKIGKANVIIGALTIASLLLITIAYLPTNTPLNLALVMVLICITFLWAIRGTYWSILGECQVSNKVMGLAIGLISLIGYLPDVFSPMINTLSTRIFGGEWAHNGYFIISAAFGFIGVGLVILFKKLSISTQKR
jgi:MFS family permease